MPGQELKVETASRIALTPRGDHPVTAAGDARSHHRGAAWRLARSRPGLRLRHHPALLRAPPDHAQKKTAHAAEQDRPDVLKQRQAWFENQLDLDPHRLVFIDETWASTNMARSHGRCRRGERLRAGVPHGHWKTTTFVAGLTAAGMIAPWVLDGPIRCLRNLCRKGAPPRAPERPHDESHGPLSCAKRCSIAARTSIQCRSPAPCAWTWACPSASCGRAKAVVTEELS